MEPRAARCVGGPGWTGDRAWGAAAGALASTAIVGGRAMQLSFGAQSSQFSIMQVKSPLRYLVAVAALQAPPA